MMYLFSFFTSESKFRKEISKARVYLSLGRITEAVEHLEKAAKFLKNAHQKLEFLEITLRLPPEVNDSLFAKYPKIFGDHFMPVHVITKIDKKIEKQKIESLKEAQKEIAASES